MTQPVSLSIPLPPRRAAPADVGATCKRCGATTFRTFTQTFRDGTKHLRVECAGCGTFQRYAPQSGPEAMRYQPRPADAHKEETTPPPSRWPWVGMIRLADGVWRAVALADDLGRCWDALLHYPGTGDLLVFPVRPESVRRAEGRVAP
jgi:hypothetical protein